MKYSDFLNYKECIMARDETMNHYVPLIMCADTFKSVVSVNKLDDKVFVTCKQLKLIPLTSIERTLIAGVRTTLIEGNDYYIVADRNCKLTYNFIDTDNYEYAVIYNPVMKTRLGSNEVDMRVSDTLKYKLIQYQPALNQVLIQLTKHYKPN